MKIKIILNMIIIFFIVRNAFYSQDMENLKNHITNIQRKKIEKVRENTYKVSDILTGRSYYKNLGNYAENLRYNNIFINIDTTVIYPDSVDTTKFTGMYEFWMKVPVGFAGPGTILIGDVNKNGKVELYGERINSYLNLNERSIYEYNPSTGLFDFKTDMPWDSITDYSSFKQIYDINADGKENVFISGTYQEIDTMQGITVGRVFKLNDSTNLPTEILFDYKQSHQMNDPKWGEYDKRDGSDLFYCAEGPDLRVAAAKYDKSTNTASTVWTYIIPDSIFYLAGLSNEDVDGDGYPDFGTGGLRGDIVVFEYQEDIQNYKDVWYGDAGTFNVYIHFNTNDINRNGKKEMWVGGDATYNGIAKTRLTCLEAVGNNKYEAKHVIDIVNRISFDAYNAFSVDIDNDGIDEIGLCLDQTFMILKFTGDENKWSFKLFYLKLNDFEKTETTYDGALMYDIDSDNQKELLIMVAEYFFNYEYIRYKTYIYKPTELVSIKEIPKQNLKFNLFQNYPNPFNPVTTIEYVVEREETVNINVYNLLGQKLKTLIEEKKSPGTYKVIFDGSDFPSGVYLIKMNSGNYSNVIKALLIK